MKDQVWPGRHVPGAAQVPDSAQEASRPQEEPSSQVAACRAACVTTGQPPPTAVLLGSTGFASHLALQTGKPGFSTWTQHLLSATNV